MKRLFLILTLGFSAIGYVDAQADFEGTLRAGPKDAGTYLQNYMEPGVLSFANGLASGWVNTAKTHKILGLDLTVAANIAAIPDEALSFAFSGSNWSNLIIDSGSDLLPTFVGGPSNTQLKLRADAEISDGQGNSILYTSESSPFGAADGIDLENDLGVEFAGLPTPTFHVGIGIVKNTDLKIRFIPSFKSDNFEFNMFGIGVMHDIKQWIPPLKLVPIDIAGFFGTTSMNVKVNYNFSSTGNDKIEVQDGSTEFKVSSTTIQILASKKLAILTPYISIGYNIVSSNLDVLGTYTYTNDIGQSIDLVDPVTLDFGGGSSPRATIGARLKLLILTLHADYTFQEYRTFSAGVGISIR